ncbi:MAG: uroporphyrinogen-III C-methyltransferase [Candidatus Onthomonas sp.]
MPHFPLFVDLTGQPILVVGGGAVALRKLQKLAPYGGSPTVVAPEILPEIAILPGVTLRRRTFRVWDLLPRPALVIAATDDLAVNHRISVLCQKRHIPVNAADDPEHCSFLFPALVQQGRFSAGISTGGASPTAAACFKTQLQSLLPERLDEILDWLDAQRPAVKAAIDDQSKRAAVLRRMCFACLEKGAPLTEAEAARCLSGENLPAGSVALVGAGCGKADLITLRGLRLLQQCQAVVYDDLIDPVLLDAVPESARKIYMGKRSGAHSAPQEEINRTLIDLAREGLQVVRLKGGDPYLFGRGGEEMLALQEAGIPCQEVPGVPSAIGIPAEYGIPVTHRGVSQGLHIVTAHTAGTPDGLPADFDELAKLSGTLVFLMGLQQLPRIVSRLMAAGKPGDTPAAVLSGGNAPRPAQVRATLSELVEVASAVKVTAPAIILVGEVAALELREP